MPPTLPPALPIQLDPEIIDLLSRADQAIGRLDGTALLVPNPRMFTAMYIRREAVESSRIEGSVSTIEDVYSSDVNLQPNAPQEDVEEVTNYVRATNAGIERLSTLPMSLRLIREIHAELMHGVRGSTKSPGQFRSVQNWIGPPGSTLANATFVPPSVPDMTDALSNLEAFLHYRSPLPFLVQCGIVHAQFEGIHPFLDGNGRVGRLLITLQLVDRNVLRRPVLYLSAYFKQFQHEYYAALQAIHTRGDWQAWLRYFLTGIAVTAEDASRSIAEVLDLLQTDRARADGLGTSRLPAQLVDQLFFHPVVTSRTVADLLSVSQPTADTVIRQLTRLGILIESTGRRRSREYHYASLLALLHRRLDF